MRGRRHHGTHGRWKGWHTGLSDPAPLVARTADGKPAPLTRRQGDILSELGAIDGATARQLSTACLNMPVRPWASADVEAILVALRYFEARGFVERHERPRQRRAESRYTWHVTEAGWDAIDAYNDSFDDG